MPEKPLSEPARHAAADAIRALGAHRSDHQRLSIQCKHSHHLGFVYDTGAGLVYWTRTGPHSHGSRDFIDTGRHGSHGGAEYVELLEAGGTADDGLPAWCECGPRTVSRRQVLDQVRAHGKTLRLP